MQLCKLLLYTCNISQLIVYIPHNIYIHNVMHTCSEVISAGTGQVSVLARDWGESREAAGTAGHTATEKELTRGQVQNCTNFPLDFLV